MAKTQTAQPNTTQQKTDRQGRKKQAKREAKLMLKIEQAKKDVQKAEQRVARAQATLEGSRTQLRDLEQKLNEARASEQPETQTIQERQTRSPEVQHARNNGASSQEQLSTAPGTPQADTAAMEAFHIASISPSEGRDDIGTAQNTAQTEAEDQSAQQVINAEIGSSFEPAEGREDISVNGEKIQATEYSSTNEDQPLTQAESDTTSSPSSEPPDVIAQTDAPAPDDIALSEGNTPADDQAQHAARDIRLTEGDTPTDDMGNTIASTEEETATTETQRKRNSRRAHATAEHKDEENQ